MSRSTRLLGVFAASALLATGLSTTAHADVSEQDTSTPLLASAVTDTPASTTQNGITAALTPTSVAGAGLTYTFNASSSTDSNSGATITSYSFAYGDGDTTTDNTSGVVTHTYTTPGTYTVSVTVTDSAGNTATTSTSVTTVGNDYTPDGPIRFLDTRSGLDAPEAKVANGDTIAVQITGVDGVPSDATAVVFNLITVDTVDSGSVTAYADGTTKPGVSDNYFSASETVDDLITAPIGTDGEVDLTVNGDTGASTDLVADLQGYYSPTDADGYVPIQPGRILDTRSTLGGEKGLVDDGKTIAVTIEGATAINETNSLAGNTTVTLPSSGITAVAATITVTEATDLGVVTAYADGSTEPSSNNINYTTGNTIADAAIIPVGSDGKIDLTVGGSTGTSTDLILDVTGYYVAGNSATGASAYVPLSAATDTAPFRVWDTRQHTDGAIAAAGYLHVPGTAATEVSAYALNVTAVSPQDAGDLSVYPDATSDNETSNLNFGAGAIYADFAQATSSSTGVDIGNNSSGDVQIVVDEFGYFTTD